MAAPAAVPAPGSVPKDLVFKVPADLVFKVLADLVFSVPADEQGGGRAQGGSSLKKLRRAERAKSFAAANCVLPAVYCLLPAACCQLPAACCLLPATCYLLTG